MTPSPSGEERAVAELFAASMDDAGMAAELQQVPGDHHMPASWNAIGRLPGTGGGLSLMFNGHTDHNPVCEGWTRDPFGGVIEDGWLYGFVHMKAADACYVAAVDAVRRAGIELKGDVVVAHVCGELRGGTGHPSCAPVRGHGRLLRARRTHRAGDRPPTIPRCCCSTSTCSAP